MDRDYPKERILKRWEGAGAVVLDAGRQGALT